MAVQSFFSAVLLALLSLTSALGPQGSDSLPNIAQGKWLRAAVNTTGARCLDGKKKNGWQFRLFSLIVERDGRVRWRWSV
jgi:hypothetical protein